MVYDALMRCSWETLRTFAGNDRQLQGTPGAIAVLHTNTRRLDYHPHVHLLMPAAAVDGTRRRWRTKRPGKGKGPTLFSHKALARVFRAKMLAAISAAGLSLPERHPVEWVVDCKSVGTGAKALITLGRTLYRGVISALAPLPTDLQSTTHSTGCRSGSDSPAAEVAASIFARNTRASALWLNR